MSLPLRPTMTTPDCISASIEIEPNAAPGFNLDCLENMEDDQYTIDILQIFLQQTPGELEMLNKAVDQGNFKEIAAIAHRLKGSICLFEISDIFKILEFMEHNAQTEKSKLLEMVNAAKSLYQPIETQLVQHLQVLNSRVP